MRKYVKILLFVTLAFCSAGVLMAQNEKTKATAAQVAGDRAFLEKNKTQSGVIVTASGLQYKVVKMGTGPKPQRLSRVQMNYTLRLFDGKIVGSNGNVPFDHHMDKAYYGMEEALKMMPVGSKWILYMPSNLCGSKYEKNIGGEGRGLTCTIELLSINQ
jgi:FKBP-type peptidyl-prolyl cis-trans isomerase